MDTLTHALCGALVARAAVPARPSHTTRADCVTLGFVAAAFPDADVVFSYFSPLAYLYLHRGITHSVLLLPLWALAVAWVWSRLRRRPQALRSYFLVASLAIGIHILGDLITSFGTLVLAPLSDHRFAWDTTFIIDLWLTGMLVVALIICAVFRRTRLPAVLGLAVVCGYVGFQAVLQQRAEQLGIEYARAEGIEPAAVNALPRPVSPFNWMVIVAGPQHYHYSFVNLRRSRPRVAGAEDGLIARLDAPHMPIDRMQWQSAPRPGIGGMDPLARAAWSEPRFQFFRWFAAYPVFSAIEGAEGAECVWFQDLRFLSPGRDHWPFRYGMCRGPAGAWQPFEALEGGRRLPL